MDKVALYARVSTEEQAKAGSSIETQLDRLRSYTKFKEWTIYDEFVDHGWSGKDDNRPGLGRLMVAAQRRHIDIVTVTKLDRFMRNTRLLLQYVDDFKNFGIRFVAADDNIDTGEGKTGELMLTILAAVAQWERERIGERIREGRHYRTSQGKWTAGATLFGYRWIPKEETWQIVKHEEAVIRKIYDLYLNQNLGSQRIPFLLNTEGIRTRQGSKWNYSSVLRILSHSAYMGKHPNGIEMPPIIDEHTWQAAQERRSKGRQVCRDSRNWLLQGLVFCGLCGYTLTCRQRTNGAPRYYRCPGRTRSKHLDNSPYCTLLNLSSDWLEKEVWDKFAAALTDSSILEKSIRDALAKLEERKKQMEVVSEPLDRQLEKVRGAIERHGIAFADGAISEDIYREKLPMLKKQEVDLAARKVNLDPEAQLEVNRLEDYIAWVKKLLDKGGLIVEPDGIWAYEFGQAGGLIDAENFGVGLDVEEIIERANSPTKPELSIKESEDFIPLNTEAFRHPKEARIASMRSILQKFNVKVVAFPDRIEIRGFIPIQVIRIPAKTVQSNGVRDIYSASRM